MIGMFGGFVQRTRWCPSSLAKLVQITPITIAYVRYIYAFYGYKPTSNWEYDGDTMVI